MTKLSARLSNPGRKGGRSGSLCFPPLAAMDSFFDLDPAALSEIRLENVTVFESPNIYAYRPVVRGILDIGRWDDIPSTEIPGFTDALVRLLPGLREHTCSRGYEGGFVERLREGTYLAHIVEHVGIELQHQLGYKVGYGKTRGTGRTGSYYVVVTAESVVAGKEALTAAVAVVSRLLEKTLAGAIRDSAAADPDLEALVRESLARVRRVARRYDLGPSTRAIAEAALARGIPAFRLGSHSSLMQLGYGCHQKRVQATVTAQTSAIGVDIASDKWLTKRLLQDLRIPVAEGCIVEDEDEAVEAALELGTPVVVKPFNSNHGRGVSLGLIDEMEIRTAVRLAKIYSQEVLVERQVHGKDYRLLVVAGEVVAGSLRRPAQVVGDGILSVRQLVEKENTNPLRGDDHDLPLTRIPIDPVVVMVLARQGLTLDSAPAAGRTVCLRDNGNLSTGGTAEDVTDFIHPANSEVASRAVRALGLDVAGVDIVAEDIAMPIESQGGAIIEVNASPGLRMHLFPARGQRREVGQAIVNMLFPGDAPSRIPIVAITGSNGKTTTTRLVGHILRAAGLRVGTATSDGIYIGEDRVISGDTTGPWSAQTVLRDPSVEAAVLEVARGGLIEGGLGYDAGRVGVVLNVTGDHVGQHGVRDLEDLARVKSLVIECLRPGGTAVLNADDPLVSAMADRVRSGVKVVFFSRSRENPVLTAHLEKGGEACFVGGRQIVWAGGGRVARVVAVRDIPATFGGLARHNVENALAATAAAIALGIPRPVIRRALSRFAATPEINPGRLNILVAGDVRVVVDYAHNAAGLAATGELLRRLAAEDRARGNQLMGVIASPGDRRDEDIRSVGGVAGRIFDRVYIKEDVDLRGRAPGEVAELLREGLLAASFPAARLETVLDEAEAVRQALGEAGPGDTVAVFYEDYSRVVDEVSRFAAQAGHAVPDGEKREEEERLVAAGVHSS